MKLRSMFLATTAKAFFEKRIGKSVKKQLIFNSA